jgi:catechol 2,3-dioxygenase-like lactoylglutathione lyase family enzyme
MNRRDAMRLLGAGVVAASTRAADAPLRFTKLDHIETNAPNALKTAEFYARTFGGPIWKNKKTERRYVRLGPCYIAIENGREPPGVDHFSAGIANYQIAEIHAFLEKRGIPYRDYPSGKDLNVTDPDGIHVQLSADNTWGPLAENTAAVEPERSKASRCSGRRALSTFC